MPTCLLKQNQFLIAAVYSLKSSVSITDLITKINYTLHPDVHTDTCCSCINCLWHRCLNLWSQTGRNSDKKQTSTSIPEEGYTSTTYILVTVTNCRLYTICTAKSPVLLQRLLSKLWCNTKQHSWRSPKSSMQEGKPKNCSWYRYLLLILFFHCRTNLTWHD